MPLSLALSKKCCKNSILSEMLEIISQKSKKIHQIKEKLISLQGIVMQLGYEASGWYLCRCALMPGGFVDANVGGCVETMCTSSLYQEACLYTCVAA